MPNNEKICFVISPIGSDESETRKRSDQVLNHIIKPAAESCEYTVRRADHISTPGSITNQLILDVINADLVIADLTGLNPNVMYELGIRHAARVPTIHIIENGQRLPFDLSTHRTIFLNHNDLDSADNARRSIVSQIEDVHDNPTGWDNPVTVALNVSELHGSDQIQDRTLAEIVEELQEIRSIVLRVYHASPINAFTGAEGIRGNTPEVWEMLRRVGGLLRDAQIEVPHNGGEPLKPKDYLGLINHALSRREFTPEATTLVRQALELLERVYASSLESVVLTDIWNARSRLEAYSG